MKSKLKREAKYMIKNYDQIDKMELAINIKRIN